MLLMSLILIKLNSAVTFKRDKAIPFNGITIIVLLLSSGYGIYSSLYQVSSLTQTFSREAFPVCRIAYSTTSTALIIKCILKPIIKKAILLTITILTKTI